MGMCCEKKTMIGWRNVWSMKWRAPGQEVDQTKLGERLWKKTVEHVDWIRRMPWFVVDGESTLGWLMTTMSVSGWMFLLVLPAHPGCPGQIPQSRKTVVCVCVCGDTNLSILISDCKLKRQKITAAWNNNISIPQEQWSSADYQLTCPSASKNEISISAVAKQQTVQSESNEMAQQDNITNYHMSTGMVRRQACNTTQNSSIFSLIPMD